MQNLILLYQFQEHGRSNGTEIKATNLEKSKSEIWNQT